MHACQNTRKTSCLLTVLSVMRSGQMWMGKDSSLYQPQVYGWSKGWQAVVIKTIPWTWAAQQEEDALKMLWEDPRVNEWAPAPCYVTQLLDSYMVPTGPNNQRSLCLVTKYAACASACSVCVLVCLKWLLCPFLAYSRT